MKALEEANKILGTNYKSWEEISRHKTLSENFMREFQDKIDWWIISYRQKLSESFIREFKEQFYSPICCDFLLRYQNMSDELKEDIKTNANVQ